MVTRDEFGAGIRLALGLALLLVAEHSALPSAFTIFGWIMLAAAVAIPFIGTPRIQALIDWMETLPTVAVRAWVLVGIAFGVFLLLGVRPLFA